MAETERPDIHKTIRISGTRLDQSALYDWLFPLLEAGADFSALVRDALNEYRAGDYKNTILRHEEEIADLLHQQKQLIQSNSRLSTLIENKALAPASGAQQPAAKSAAQMPEATRAALLTNAPRVYKSEDE